MDMIDDQEDDDMPQLSSAALAALAAFHQEREETERQFQQLQQAADTKWKLGMKPFPEDWQLSQFWYSDETAHDLAQLVYAHARSPTSRIAFISTPTAFVKYMELMVDAKIGPAAVVLFEFDRRFATYGEQFVFYDYKTPLALPQSLRAHSFDFILLDPPFLSEECFEKTAQTVMHLAAPNAKIVACTGLVMREHVKRLLGLDVSSFRPKHQKNLSNEFACYANFDFDDN